MWSIWSHQIQLHPILFKMISPKCFGEDINYLVLSIAEKYFNLSFLHMISVEVMSNIYVLSPHVMDMVRVYVDCSTVVTE